MVGSRSDTRSHLAPAIANIFEELRLSAAIRDEGPWRMVFDPVNRIIYNATWGSGAWALSVSP